MASDRSLRALTSRRSKRASVLNALWHLIGRYDRSRAIPLRALGHVLNALWHLIGRYPFTLIIPLVLFVRAQRLMASDRSLLGSLLTVLARILVLNALWHLIGRLRASISPTITPSPCSTPYGI